MAFEPHDARAVANAILAEAKKRGLNLTLMQLIKLVYLTHGWSLAMLEHGMVKSPVQAWQYGPVYPEVYAAFKEYGSTPITAPARSRVSGAIYQEEFSQDEIELIDAVLDTYGHLHAFQLSNMMHRPGAWTLTFNENGAYSVISDTRIKEHFDALRDARRG